MERAVVNALPNQSGFAAESGSSRTYLPIRIKMPAASARNSHYDRRNGNVEQQSDSGENQVDGEQEHSKIFCDHHGCFLT